MKAAIFSAHNFEKPYLLRANADTHELVFLETRLIKTTAALAMGCQAVSLFSSDTADAQVLPLLHKQGVRYLALRSAGFNHVNLETAKELGMQVARVPAYSPYAIAEHTVALILALNRKLIRAYRRVQELNFSLDGLTGFDLHGKTVGIIGTGKIGSVFTKIMHGFGCHLLAFDMHENEQLKKDYGLKYVSLDQLCQASDIISLHVPLNEQTHYMINAERINDMKPGVMLINTSRGGLVETKAVINALKRGHVGAFGIDVYEEEGGLFFEDHSDENVLQDDVIARLMTFKNVFITSHQAFLTDTALRNIADTTIHNLNCFASGKQDAAFLDSLL